MFDGFYFDGVRGYAFWTKYQAKKIKWRFIKKALTFVDGQPFFMKASENSFKGFVMLLLSSFEEYDAIADVSFIRYVLYNISNGFLKYLGGKRYPKVQFFAPEQAHTNAESCD